jgi:hypothetical protein
MWIDTREEGRLAAGACVHDYVSFGGNQASMAFGSWLVGMRYPLSRFASLAHGGLDSDNCWRSGDEAWRKTGVCME